jgi:hypothetical protein
MKLVPLALAAILLFLLAPPANAQDVEAPPNAVVATTPQGATLAAADLRDRYGDYLVLTLRAIDPGSDPDSFAETSSEFVPLWPDESVVVSENTFRDDGTERIVVGGAVSADVAAVEQRFDDGTVLRMATVPGDGYAGRYAGRVRFFAGERLLSGDDESDDLGQLRMLDASGTVVGVAGEAERNEHNVRLERKRVHGRLIRIRGTLSDERAPLPLAPENLRQTLCLSTRIGAGELAEDSDTVCQEDKPDLHALRLGGVRGCGAMPSTLEGFVPAATRELVVVLGSGRVVRYSARTTPFGRPERVVAAVLPRGEAIRRVWALDAAGRRLAQGDAGVAPPDRGCTAETYDTPIWSFYSTVAPAQFGQPPGTEVAAEDPAGSRLLVRDRGEQLCWGVDRLALDGRDCQDPPVNSHGEYLLAQPSAGGLVVSGIVAARVATFDVALAGGGRIAVPLTDGPGYTGRYRGTLRFALFTLAADAQVSDIAFLDAAGQQVGTGVVECPACEDDDAEPRPVMVLAAGAGEARVRVGASATVAGPLDLNACLAFATAGETLDECTLLESGDGTVGALVSCSPRRTIVYGMTHHAVRRVEIELASGRRVAARLAAFPRRLHVPGRAFLAVLPRDASVTAVRFAGFKNTISMPLRPARRQCGYTFEADLTSD